MEVSDPYRANDGAIVGTLRDLPREGRRMLINRFTGLFRRRCPLCKQEVSMQGGAAVQRFGKWFCSKAHADLYELELYEALRTVHCHHAACHGEYVPLPEAVGTGFSRPNAEQAHLKEDLAGCVNPLS
jgi:hypothetical protein